ncbi:MAG: glycosyltransferase family 4 protein [Armatimonadetes bacterium]|nr:glycosyltransferase family 4 protein [Armatimonadota bacterium]
MRKLCVFPNDPLKAYLQKGELKPRYLNPGNLFDEIHVMSPADSDATAEEVSILAGDARMLIHPLGELSYYMTLPVRTPYDAPIESAMKYISEVRPNVVRAYNPVLAGWMAVKCGRALGIPVLVSVHGHYDLDERYQDWKNRRWKRLRNALYSRFFIEPYVIRNADKIICAYRWPYLYAKQFEPREIEIIYNRVDLSRFRIERSPRRGGPLKILNVSRMIRERGQHKLILAIRDLDAHLTLIGDGEQYRALADLARTLNLEERVCFIRSVPNQEIQRHYGDADLLAVASEHGGIHIPTLEAMASGLPLVVARNRWEQEPEAVGDIAVVVENTPESFERAFQQLIEHPDLLAEMGRKSSERALLYGGEEMEEKEKKAYESLFREA